MGIRRIGYPQGSKRSEERPLLTLNILRDSVSQNLRDEDESAQEFFWKRCREADFEGRRKTLNDKISTIRNQHLAHLYLEPESVRPITLGELQELRDILYDLLQVLFFDSFPVLTLWAYGPTNRPTDIDKLLDSAIRDSHRLNWPESSDPLCADWIQTLSEDDLNLYNKYRRKFGKRGV